MAEPGYTKMAVSRPLSEGPELNPNRKTGKNLPNPHFHGFICRHSTFHFNVEFDDPEHSPNFRGTMREGGNAQIP
jgi:hypothetical protein